MKQPLPPTETLANAATEAVGEAATLESPSALSPSTSGPHAAPPRLVEGDDFGPYKIVRLLGRGGMGEVYEAELREGGERVALKLLGQAIADDAGRARFQREGRLAAAVNHPNSVYVYGTDEIRGVPVIAMELVTGGTLKDRVAARGPLPVAEAVDAVLELCAGLEAAAGAGVLHRDIKPANCFVDESGRVKVGDYGLALAVEAQGESQISRTGGFLGTPAFASPEQIRGQPLDVRSDIYSVGATLYYLLTGRLPVESTGGAMHQAIAVLEQKPAPLRTLRHDVPRGLSSVIARCLEKDRAARFADHAALASALAPFASTSPTAAPLGARVGATVIDLLIVAAIALAYQALVVIPQLLAEGTTTRAASWRLAALVMSVYAIEWCVGEGLWGASPGKALLGLRVVDRGGGAPGPWRAILRAGVLAIVAVTPVLVAMALPSGPTPPASGPSMAIDQVSDDLRVVSVKTETRGVWALELALPVLAFAATARRRNGWRGLHELASGTRVVLRTVRDLPTARAAQASVPTVDADARRVGPYRVLRTIAEHEGVVLSAAWDPRLRRRVWLREGSGEPPATPPVEKRELRPRPLGGRRDGDRWWEACEVPAGAALLDPARAPLDVRAMRRFLVELGEAIALRGSVDLTRVWLAGDGRVRLLDFTAPDAQPEPPPADAQRLLHRAALVALGHRDGTTPRLALGDRALLDDLAAARLADLDAALAAIRARVGRPVVVTPSRALSQLGLFSAAPLLCALTFTTLIATLMRPSSSGTVEVLRFNNYAATLDETAELEAPTAQQRQHQAEIETALVGRFGARVRDGSIWRSPIVARMPEAERRRVEELVRTRAAPSPDELARAEAAIGPLFEIDAPKTLEIGLGSLEVLLFVLALGGLFSSLALREGLTLRLSGIALVRRDGRRASRGRTFLRALLVLAPFVAAAVVNKLVHLPGAASSVLVLGLLALGALSSLRTPERAPHDRVVGTWRVPR